MPTPQTNQDSSIFSNIPAITSLLAGSPKTTTSSPYSGYLQSTYNTAVSNANNPAITQNVVQNIMRNAAISFAPVLGQQSGAGLYNSNVVQMLGNQAQGIATQEAAQSVLNYQTSQMQIAGQAAGQLSQANRQTKTAPAIPTSISQVVGLLSAGKSIFDNKDKISNFVKDPVGSIKSLFGGSSQAPTGEEAIAAQANATQDGLNLQALNSAYTGGGNAVSYSTGAGADSVLSNGVGTGASDIAGVGSDVGGLATDVANPVTASLFDSSGITSAGDVAGAGGDIAGAADTASALEGGSSALEDAGVLGSSVGAAADVGGTLALGSAAGDAAIGSVVTGAGLADAGAAAGAAGAAGGLADALPAVLAWIICTEFVKQGRLPRKYWIYGAKVFASYPTWGKNGYFIWAIPSVTHIRKYPYSLYSRVLCKLFNIRAEHLAAKAGCRGAKKSIAGYILDKGLYAVCWTVAVIIYPFYDRDKHLASLGGNINMADSPSIPSDLGDIDISSLMQSAGTASGAIDKAASDLTKSLGLGELGMQSEQSGFGAEAEAQQTINTATMQASLQKKADDNNIAAIWGTNPHASSFVLASLSNDITGLESDLDKRGKDLQDKRDVRLTDDPVSWLMAQITLPADEAGYNNVVNRLNAKQDQAAELAARTQEGFVTNAAIDANASEKLLDGQNKLALAQAAIKVGQSQERIAQLGLQGVDISSRLTADKFNQQLGLFNATAQVQDLKMRALGLNYTKEMVDAQAAYRDAMVEDRKNNDAATAALQQKLDRVTSSLGVAKITWQEFKTMQGPMKNAIDQFMADPSFDQGQLGFNTITALNNVNGINAPLTPGVNQVRKQLAQVIAATQQDQSYQALGRDPEKEKAYIQAKIETTVQDEAKNIPATGGFYSPPPLKTVLSNPNVTGLQLAKPLADMALKNPLLPTRADDIYTQAIAQIASGGMTVDQATAEINRIYNTINITNSNLHQYTRLALPTPTSFKTGVNVMFSWGGNKVIDMTSPAEVKAALTRSLIIQQTNESAPGGAAP